MAKMVNRSPKAMREAAPPDDDDDAAGTVVDHADDDLAGSVPDPEPDETPDDVDSGDEPSDVVPADSAAPAAESAEPAESPQLTGIRAYLANRGLTQFAQAENDEAAVQALLEASTTWLTRASQAQRQAEQQAAYYYQQLATGQHASQQAGQSVQQGQAVPETRPKWEAPEFDPAWAVMLTKDENGNIVARPGADPTLPQKWAKAQEHFQKVNQRLATDPAGLLNELGYAPLDVIEQRVNERLTAWQNQMLEQQVLNNRINENLGWMVEHDQSGRPVVDPGTGRYRPTIWGQKFHHYIIEAHNRGIGTAEAQFDYARRSVEAEAMEEYLRQQAAGQKPAPSQGDKNLQYMRDQATRKPSRSGTLERPELGRQPAQNGRRLSFVERAKKNAAAMGVDWNSEVEV